MIMFALKKINKLSYFAIKRQADIKEDLRNQKLKFFKLNVKLTYI